MVLTVQTLVPFFAKGLFSIEENELDGIFWLFALCHHPGYLQQSPGARSTIVCPDKSELFKRFCIVMTGDQNSLGALSWQFANDIEHFHRTDWRLGFKRLSFYRQAITLQLVHYIFLDLFDGRRTRWMRSKFNLFTNAFKRALSIEFRWL